MSSKTRISLHQVSTARFDQHVCFILDDTYSLILAVLHVVSKTSMLFAFMFIYEPPREPLRLSDLPDMFSRVYIFGILLSELDWHCLKFETQVLTAMTFHWHFESENSKLSNWNMTSWSIYSVYFSTDFVVMSLKAAKNFWYSLMWVCWPILAHWRCST